MDKTRLMARFSRSAGAYEDFDSLQRGLAERLFLKVSGEFNLRGTSLLDIGTGTGRMLGRIKQRFPDMRALGLDFSEGMLRSTAIKDNLSGVPLCQADAESLPFKEGTFDFIISNSAYQWVNDLAAAFLEARRVLKQGGIFCFSVFGRDTLRELNFCIKKIEPDACFYPLPEEKKIKKLLEESDFNDIELSSELHCSEYKNIEDILMWLKSTGTSYRREAVFTGLGGRGFIRKIEEAYRAHFGDFKVTHQEIIVKALRA